MTQPRAVICAVARTPIGKFMGSYSSMSAVDLGVATVKELLARANIDPASGVVDEVIFGQVLQAGAGQNPARQVALKSGLPVTTPCVTVNKVCGSSLKAAMMAIEKAKDSGIGMDQVKEQFDKHNPFGSKSESEDEAEAEAEK